MSVVSNSTQNAKAWINGQYREVTQQSDGNWYVEINGQMTKVNPNDIFGINSDLTEHPKYLVDYYTKLLKKSDEKKEALKKESVSLNAILKVAKEKFDKFLASLGIKSVDELSNYSCKKSEAKKQLYAMKKLRSAYNRNCNDLLSECRKGFDYALERGNWQNQLNLAEHVQESFY